MSNLRIDFQRLRKRLDALAAVGALEGGGCCRLALTDADRQGRDLVVEWMKDLDLTVSIDSIGNVVGIRPGREQVPPVVTGSHIDTVRTGGILDGNLGVLAGLEVVETLNQLNIETDKPVAVAFFTNEEGARFAPDMMGSGVQQGTLDLAECLSTVGIDGTTVGEDLERIGYAGTAASELEASAFVELHIEQGPVLDREGTTIGAVTGVQGISWTQIVIEGVSNHAGTTPMSLRRDAGYAAARIAVMARNLALDIGNPQVATVGAIDLSPNLVNVVANRAVLTLDLRHTDDSVLTSAEERAFAAIDEICSSEGVRHERRSLARFKPVEFDPELVAKIEATAESIGFSCRRLPSGAGHDAQMFARNCPAAMIFVPSIDGISHNIGERTDDMDLEAGANVLANVLLDLAGGKTPWRPTQDVAAIGRGARLK